MSSNLVSHAGIINRLLSESFRSGASGQTVLFMPHCIIIINSNRSVCIIIYGSYSTSTVAIAKASVRSLECYSHVI